MLVVGLEGGMEELRGPRSATGRFSGGGLARVSAPASGTATRPTILATRLPWA